MKNNRFGFVLIFFIMATNASFACTCVDTNETLSIKVKKSYVSSNLVVTGKIIDKNTTHTSINYHPTDTVIYTLELKEKFKGENNSRSIKIRSNGGCGFSFEIGQYYLIYTYTLDGANVTDICTRTRDLNEVKKEELSVLKKLSSQRKSKTK
ncbi:MAG: hypothetical protein QNJ57_07390 [Flavobacteriaceae bacterium]|nr:hypothetical protein [Flavobacteriaceae bacterium]